MRQMKTEFTTEDIHRGLDWYEKHSDHVHSLIDDETSSFSPSGSDISHPELWKPAHWRWFLAKVTDETDETDD